MTPLTVTIAGLLFAPGTSLHLSCPLPPLAQIAPGPIDNPFAVLNVPCDGPIGTVPTHHYADLHCLDGQPLALPVGCRWEVWGPDAAGAWSLLASGVNGGALDQNQDGFTDGADIDLFTNWFEAGDARVDFNADGFQDGADMDLFSNVWEAQR